MKKKLLGFMAGVVLNAVAFAKVDAPALTLKELKELQPKIKNKEVVLVDANSYATYKEGRIPGAISYDENRGNLATVLEKDGYKKDAIVVAYCGGPKCVAWKSAAEEAEKAGFKNLRHFPGGISGWKEAKLDVEKGK